MTATQQTDTVARPDLVGAAVRVMPYVVFLVTCAAVVRFGASPLVNQDTFFHLRFGHEFLTDWSLRDPGSVTPFATREWLPTQWSAQILMARMEDWFGLAGVAWLSGAQMVMLTIALYVAARRQAPMLAASIVTLFALAAMEPTLSARPQVLSFVLVAVFTVAGLDSAEDGKPRWWLVPLTWVWATAHGMWPIGIAIALVAAVGTFADRDHALRTRTRLFLVPLGCAVAAALTPLGPSLYGAVFNVGSRAHYFYEWSSPDFTNRMPMVTAAMFALTVLLRLRAGRVRFVDLGLIALAGGALLLSIRTLPVAAAMLTPLLAASLRPHVVRQRVTRPETAVVVSAALASLVVLAALVPTTAGDGPHQPSWLNSRLGVLPDGTVLLNEWNYGGYLMWRYPDLDLVMHGYGDTFTTAELDRNEDILTVAPGWDDRVREIGARYALLMADSPLAYGLENSLGWRVVDETHDVVYLEAPAEGATSAG